MFLHFRWSLIAGRLPGRTANDVKNYWNCHLSKKLSVKQIGTGSGENTDIRSIQVKETQQPLDLSGIVSLRSGGRTCLEEALTYYPQLPQLEPPPPEIGAPTQFLGVQDREELQYEEKKGAPAEENGIVLGDLPSEFQLDEVRADGFGSNKLRWDWDDLFMDMDLWNSTL